MRKILFLDVDGVLNNSTLFQRSKENPTVNILPEMRGYLGIDRDLLETFRSIVDQHPEVEIVLSSTWRYRYTNMVELAFARAAIPFNLIASTPSTFSGHRGREIQMWIEQNLFLPARLVAIDDDLEATYVQTEPQHKYFHAQTSWHEGLTPKIVEQVNTFLEYGNFIGVKS